MYRYEILSGENGYVVHIYNDTDLLIIQPFNPETGKPFLTEDEAKAWAEDFISLMVPPDVSEEPTEEGAEPVEASLDESATTTESSSTNTTETSITTEPTETSTTAETSTTTETTNTAGTTETTETSETSATTDSTQATTTTEDTTNPTTQGGIDDCCLH